MDGDDLSHDPKAVRYEKMVASMKATAFSPTGVKSGVQTAK